MSTSFDENNPKFWVLFKKVHIRMAARIISICLLLLVFIDLIQSFQRSASAMIYSWLAACFAIGIYGSLIYGVFKEKRLFTLPFMCFQAVLISFLVLTLLIFTGSALFSSTTLKKFGHELGNVNLEAPPKEQAEQMRRFVIYFFMLVSALTAIQLWFLEVIYRFFYFLKERETSFNFNLENEFQMDG